VDEFNLAFVASFKVAGSEERWGFTSEFVKIQLMFRVNPNREINNDN
jgi:hypothetical protein